MSSNNQGSLRQELKRQTAKRRLFTDKNEEEDPIVDPKDDEIVVLEVKQTEASILETPKKKRRLDEGLRPFFSPKGKRIVTPEKDEDLIETPIKATPVKRQRKDTVEDDGSYYVPTYIHKNVNYQRKGQASLSDKLKRAYALVEEHFVIPKDFEQNKFDYGPQSGTCYEERVVQAYNLSLLEPKNESDVVEICTFCTKTGHKKNDCPSLI